MRIGREEALDLLNKWRVERTILLCYLRFRSLQARFDGRIAGLSPRSLHLVSDDGSSELNLTIEPWLDFGYGDTRKPGAAREFEGMLVIFFRLGAEEGDTDTITLAEIGIPE